ncbi:MAG: hypothetical protein OEZ13_03605 [Spirochaetia bacterium]|nr:hypothetical protein [Spirochaetia bacterium]
MNTAQSIRFSANLAKSLQAGSEKSRYKNSENRKFSGSGKLFVLKKKQIVPREDFESLLRQEFLAEKVELKFSENSKPVESKTDLKEQKTIQFLHDFWA